MDTYSRPDAVDLETGIYCMPVLKSGTASSSEPVEFAYRCFEFVVALVGLVLTMPLMLIAALLIKIDSPGPILFHHVRTGKSRAVPGREAAGIPGLRPPPDGFDPDRLYLVPTTIPFVKFRTMYVDARQRFPELYDYTYDKETFHQHKFKRKDDPRVTRIGNLMRRLTVDELPNLWCVLRGDVRLVGPRPEGLEFVKYYRPEEMYKFSVKMGITGLAQVSGRGELTWEETIGYDLQYVRTRTVFLDLKILVLTAWHLIVRRGAY